MTIAIRRLSRTEIESDAFWSLLWDAAGVDSDALMWIRDVELPALKVIGAVDDPDGSDRVVGFTAYEVRAGRSEIHYLGVDESARGAGIGTRLVEAVRRAAYDLPLHAQTGEAAIGFYRRLGFTISPAAQDPRWPTRQRYDCTIAPLGDPADVTLATYRTSALRYVQNTSTEPSPLVDVLRGLVPAGAHVLELGSGPGRDADAMEAAGLVVDRTDAAASFIALQHAAGHDVRLLDVRDPDHGGPYDAVFANAVLLHIPRGRLRGVLETTRRATVPGGVIVASFKKGDGEEWSERKLDAPRHYTYWREDALAQVFADAGWTQVDARDTTRPGSAEAWIAVTARNPL